MVIVNPASGRRKKEIIYETFDFLEREKIRYDWVIARRGQITQQVKEAAQRGFSPLISIGGDGTVNAVLNGIMTSEVNIPLIPIPAGIGNGFARILGIKKLEDAFRAITYGKIRRVDLGKVSFGEDESSQERFFANFFGLGPDVSVIQMIERRRKDFSRFGGVIHYIFACFEEWFSLKYPRVSVKSRIEGKIFSKENFELFWLIVANVRNYGRIFRITPKAKIDDGLLDVFLMERPAFQIDIVIDFLELIVGTHKRLSEVSVFQTEELEVSSSKPLLAHIDGEIIGPQRTYKISVLPKALKVLVPK